MKKSLSRPLTFVSALLVSASLFAGCHTPTHPAMDHWNIDGLRPRLAKRFFNYRQDLDGEFRDFQWRQRQDINMTLRRHFLNNNPENPFQPYDPSLDAPRPPYSILPNPANYVHLEGAIVGAALLGATGVFLPIPVTSVLISLMPGGRKEFVEGLAVPFTGSYGADIEEPPDVDEFRVRHR